ncbi:hypothetical protein [Glycomyces buryatensis]|uniref:Uncharacterized protein n=1 Tax=Glycomyces buryatensis TaxID=2570927 RepID=A0A4S8QRT5_9ACTN|nr:hypothetical protein [Glycomyces buryatensis]THV43354.1 hypothetical protein FAB82_01355 [Glycomyces buryatensis]
MKQKLKAVYDRLGRPSIKKLAAAVGLVLAVAFVAIAWLGDTRLTSALSLLTSLATLGALVLVWNEGRKGRAEARASHERTEVTFRRILAAIEVERLANERRAANAAVPQSRQSTR